MPTPPPSNWSKTLKQFVDKLPTHYLSLFDHFVGLTLKRVNRKSHGSHFESSFTNKFLGMRLNCFADISSWPWKSKKMSYEILKINGFSLNLYSFLQLVWYCIIALKQWSGYEIKTSAKTVPLVKTVSRFTAFSNYYWKHRSLVSNNDFWDLYFFSSYEGF